MTPSQARNAIRKALVELIDPPPTTIQKDAVWECFDSCCAYCGIELDRSRREGDMDHLIPSAKGGLNHVSNRVLSCKTCNGDEKLDMDWEGFLLLKNPEEPMHSQRRERILGWIKNVKDVPKPSADYIKKAEEEARSVIATFDASCTTMRRLRDSVPMLKKGEIKDELQELIRIAGKKEWSLTLHDIHSVLPQDRLDDEMLNNIIQLMCAMEIKVEV